MKSQKRNRLLQFYLSRYKHQGQAVARLRAESIKIIEAIEASQYEITHSANEYLFLAT